MDEVGLGAAPRQTGIYERIGVRTIVNGRGATTSVGGTLMPPEVVEAMAEAARAFVVLDELNATVGEKIAEATGAEAGYVTSGAAAGLALAAAACIAGSDPARIARLPDSEEMRNEIVIHRAHRIYFDQQYRLAGGRLVEIGAPLGTHAWELEAAITERTAAVAYADFLYQGPGALALPTVVEIAHARGVPVIVDSAASLPPVDHLRRWTRLGADLVSFSGGKGIRGPQETGLLAGRRDLIEAARLNGSPHAGIGRGMKVSKEAMVGLWVALERFLAIDHAAEHRAKLALAEAIVAGLRDREDLFCEIDADPVRWPTPSVFLRSRDGRWTAQEVGAALKEGEPAIHLEDEFGDLMVSTMCLQPGEERLVVERLRATLDQVAEFARPPRLPAPTGTR
jgi:L-seryl-tRNA(Ser) seleniumtransferase